MVVVVNFSTSQPGARVVVDGKPLWSCTTPCPIDLPRGEHVAMISLSGFHRVRRPFEVGSEPVDLVIELDAVVGTVLVSSIPTGADIFVEGEAIYTFREGYVVPPAAQPYLLDLSQHKLLGLKDWVAAQKKFKAIRTEWTDRFK